jgi:peptide/nickel transport system substrate-binding protein
MNIPTRPLRPTLCLLLLLLLLITSGACRQGEQANSNQSPARERVTGTRGGQITYRLAEPPRTFNPVMAQRESDFVAGFYLTAGRLVEFDHDARSYVGGVAESWRTLDDGRTVEITLRDGLKFSDGEPLTTADVEFTLRAIYGEKSSTIRSALLFAERPIEARVQDERRIQFVFPEQVAAPESYLVNVPVLPRHALEQAFTQGTFSTAYGVDADPKSIVTAGPFVFDSVKAGEQITLRRNPHYWKKDSAGTQLPYLDALMLEVVADQDAAFTRLQEGGLDILDRIRASDYAALQGQSGAVRAADLGPGLTTDHLIFNLNEGAPKANPVRLAWFKDARFRRAVSHALNRDSVAAGTLQGLATPIYNLVPPSHNWAATDVQGARYDPAQARALLAEAGFQTRGTAEAPELYDAGNRRVEFTLVVPQESTPRKLEAAAVQEDLARVGILVNVAPVATGDLSARLLQSFDYDVALFGATLTDFDPSSYSTLLESRSPQHQWRPAEEHPATDWEARLDELVAQVARERDPERRRAAFREAQVLMAEQEPIVPLFSRHVTCAANARVGNYRPSLVVPFSLWNVEELFVKK